MFSHHRPPAFRGRSSTIDPCGKAVQRRFEAAEDLFANHLAGLAEAASLSELSAAQIVQSITRGIE